MDLETAEVPLFQQTRVRFKMRQFYPRLKSVLSGQRQNQVTIGNYFKHLMMYDDNHLAKHPRFRFFALNTEMRWRALQTGRVYVKQHPGDAQLSLDELRDMVGREGETFSNRVLHYASSLRGTKQYWYRQRSRLLSMVDTLGLPTIFFTHSAADLQWPELAHLICPAWRANVDMQYIVSRRRVIEYCTKYVTKSEPQSQSLKEVCTSIVRSLQEGNTSLKVVQKLLINTAGARDYSAQESCHLLLQLPMFKASRDFIVLSLDGSRAVQDRLEEDQHATALSIVDHYMHRPTTQPFNHITLIEFDRQYSMPKTLGSQPTRRNRRIIVIPRPYYSPDPAGPNYEQCCCHSLMQHKCFRLMDDLLAGSEAFVDAYATFLQSGHIPPCLEDDVYRLLQHTSQDTDHSSDTEVH